MKTILMVDDEPQLLQVLSFALELEGYRVLRAENTSEALRFVTEEAIDVMITDYRMPGENGVELIEQVREMQSRPPIFMLMTGVSSATLNETEGFDCFRVLSKPFELAELSEAVRAAVQTKPA